MAMTTPLSPLSELELTSLLAKLAPRLSDAPDPALLRVAVAAAIAEHDLTEPEVVEAVRNAVTRMTKTAKADRTSRQFVNLVAYLMDVAQTRW
jgi:hypothetical protein